MFSSLCLHVRARTHQASFTSGYKNMNYQPPASFRKYTAKYKIQSTKVRPYTTTATTNKPLVPSFQNYISWHVVKKKAVVCY